MEHQSDSRPGPSNLDQDADNTPKDPNAEPAGGLDDVVDLEAYFEARRAVPHGKRYRIRIDKHHYLAQVHRMTGSQILELAGKTPEKFLLRQKLRTGVEPIGPDQWVDFTEPGIERFMTIPNEVTEGEQAPPRMQFAMLQSDVAYLNSLGLRWESVVDNGIRAVVIYQWPLPAGFTVARADVHLRLTVGYPDAQIDMAYLSPPLVRTDGRAMACLTPCTFDGREWQQWSRHRTANSAWRIGEDDLSTHMHLVCSWFEAEMKK